MIHKTDEEWRTLLAAKGAEPMAFAVTRQEATERAFTGRWADNHQKGVYSCICCGKALFLRNQIRIGQRLAQLFPALGP